MSDRRRWLRLTLAMHVTLGAAGCFGDREARASRSPSAAGARAPAATASRRAESAFVAPSTAAGRGGASGDAPRAAGCLRYEPALVRLTGVVAVESRYGPPDYGETPDRDERLRVPFLDLNAPIDVCADSTAVDDDTSEPLSDLRRVQLDLTRLRSIPPLLSGEHLSVAGSLYHSVSGQHFTAAVLAVDSIVSRSGGRPARRDPVE